MTELDALKYDLEQGRKAFDKLHKDYVELLKQQGKLEEENEQLKSEIKELQVKYSKQLVDYNGMSCEYDWLKEENEQLKRLLREVEHELTSLTGLTCFDKCASQLGYVEVFDDDMWELDYNKLLAKIEKELTE